MAILEKIGSPTDLKNLPPRDLPVLAAEMRRFIIEVVSKNGGHLASNLGTVELALALHLVFDSPDDTIVWDVGHQAYAHKLLTGRNGQFPSLRQWGGLSGFTRRSESPHDAVSTGHSSTSISAGLGIACGRHLRNAGGKVIAVIGDGAMTAGLAYEGLLQAGDLQRDLLVVLNDNNMSIGPNVGALSSFLSRTFSNRKMQEIKRDFGYLLRSLPGIGGDMYDIVRRSKRSFKTLLTPGMLFEAFRFEYFGPIDGHNLDRLIEMLRNIRFLREPVLLHVKTTKGKEYPPAEKNPVSFHGCGRFDVETGNRLSQKAAVPTYTEIFGNMLLKIAREDPRIVVITAAMADGTGLKKFQRCLPNRFFDVGIAEQHAVTFASGLAIEGFRPVVAIYSTFLQRAYDQIIHDVCIDGLPVVFAVDRGGIVGEDGPTHHGVFDLSYLRCLPNMVVTAPKDENELCRMLATALAHTGPTAIRYPRGSGLGVEIEYPVHPLPFGKAEVLQEGDDLLILAVGSSVSVAVCAQSELRSIGISATVVNCRYIKPLDDKLIASLASAIPRIITVEENVRQGGFGSAVLECLNDRNITGFSMERIGIADSFIEHGAAALLRTQHGLDAAAVVSAARRLCRPGKTVSSQFRTVAGLS